MSMLTLMRNSAADEIIKVLTAPHGSASLHDGFRYYQRHGWNTAIYLMKHDENMYRETGMIVRPLLCRVLIMSLDLLAQKRGQVAESINWSHRHRVNLAAEIARIEGFAAALFYYSHMYFTITQINPGISLTSDMILDSLTPAAINQITVTAGQDIETMEA